jgi:ATP-dependent Lon protease
LPKQLENHGITPDQLIIDNNALETIIDRYTRESGVRELDKKLAKIARVTARNIASGAEYDKSLTVERLTKILGPPKFTRDLYEGNEQAGVVTGLAWTAAGGDVLFIETSLSKGTGKLTLTGNLGDVMKESAVLAHEDLKANAGLLDLPDNFSEKWNIHIHVPEGAIPKDGPSAGITMATSIASAFTQRKVRKYVAMTGEITLRGKTLPVGGIKEKILAAKRATIKEIILPEENRNDVENISPIYIEGLTFHYVDSIMEAIDIALLKEKVNNPKNISFE